MNIEKKYANEIKDSLYPKTTFEDLNFSIPAKKVKKAFTIKKLLPYCCGLVAVAITSAIIIPAVLGSNSGEIGQNGNSTKSNTSLFGEKPNYDFSKILENRKDFAHSIPYTNYMISKSSKPLLAPKPKINAILREDYDDFGRIEVYDDDLILYSKYDFSKEMRLSGYIRVTEIIDGKANGRFVSSGIKVYNICGITEPVNVNDVFKIEIGGYFNGDFDDPVLTITQLFDIKKSHMTTDRYFEDGENFEEFSAIVKRYTYFSISGKARVIDKNDNLVTCIYDESRIKAKFSVENADEININNHLYLYVYGMMPDKTSLNLEDVYLDEFEIIDGNEFKYVNQYIDDYDFLDKYTTLNLEKPFSLNGYAKITNYGDGLISGVFYDSGLSFENVPYDDSKYIITEQMEVTIHALFDGNLSSKKLTDCYLTNLTPSDINTAFIGLEDINLETLKKFNDPNYDKDEYINLKISSSKVDLVNHKFSAESVFKNGTKVVFNNADFLCDEEYRKINFLDSFAKDNIDNFYICFNGKGEYRKINGVDTYTFTNVQKMNIWTYPIEICKVAEETNINIEKYGNPFPNDILSWDGCNLYDTNFSVAYLVPDFASDYEIKRTTYFKVEIDGRDPIVESMFGKGTIECAYTFTNFEDMLTLVKDDKIFSCCGGDMHKVIRGYYLYKDVDVSHTISVYVNFESGDIKNCGFGKVDKSSILTKEINKKYTWDEFIELENGFLEPQEEGNDIQ